MESDNQVLRKFEAKKMINYGFPDLHTGITLEPTLSVPVTSRIQSPASENLTIHVRYNHDDDNGGQRTSVQMLGSIAEYRLQIRNLNTGNVLHPASHFAHQETG